MLTIEYRKNSPLAPAEVAAVFDESTCPILPWIRNFRNTASNDQHTRVAKASWITLQVSASTTGQVDTNPL